MPFLLFAQSFVPDAAGFGEQLVRFWSSLDGAGFDTLWADGENHLTDISQDNCVSCGKPGARTKAQIFLEGVAHLQRGLEARFRRSGSCQGTGLPDAGL